MAESGSRNIGKVFQKTVTRTKEKVLQNLGKADKTKDDQFEQHEVNFSEQMASAFKLQKALKVYTERLKEMSLASTSLYRAMKEIYGADWVGYTDYCAANEDIASTWDNYLAHVDELVVEPLNTYIALFPKHKEKMSKRNRKLTDFDRARRSHDTVSSAKKMDDNKISKALDDLNETKQIYEKINSNIIDELSAFYKSRIHVTSTAFHNLITTEMNFHKNSLETKREMDQAVQKLKDDAQKFKSDSSDSVSDSPQRSQSIEDQRCVNLDFQTAHRMLVPQHKTRNSLRNQSTNNDENQIDEEPSTPVSDSLRMKYVTSPAVPAPTYQNVIAERNLRKSAGEDLITNNITDPLRNEPTITPSNSSTITPPNTSTIPTITPPNTSTITPPNTSTITPPNTSTIITMTTEPIVSTPGALNGSKADEHAEVVQKEASDSESLKSLEATEEVLEEKKVTTEEVLEEKKVTVAEIPISVEEVTNGGGADESDIPVARQQGVVPSNRVLFKVMTTHSYVGEDMDELSFEIGEEITVVPFDNPEEQDDGWLMGVKETTRERGVFPQNFTSRLD